MYFQSDYILRMIQMMGDFFRQLLENLDEAMKGQEYERFIRKQCGISGATAENLSADSLIEMLPDNPRFLLSELMYVRANAFQLDDEIRDDCLYKAFRLLLSVGKENLLCELREERLLSLYADVYEKLTAQDLADMVSFLILAQNYAKGEDILFDALASTLLEDRQMVLEKGIALYQQLNQTATDAELIQGGLPRQELLESLEELKEMSK